MAHGDSGSSSAALPLSRRSLVGAAAGIGAGLALPWPVMAQPAAAGAQAPRIALLIGNRDYPERQDLPPMHTNVRRTQAALEPLGFDCISALDLDREATLQAVAQFAARWKALPPGAVGLFYFCGHGMQIASENFLLPARLYPRERSLEDSRRLNVELGRDVRLPVSSSGDRLMISVIDACRTSPAKLGAADGMNQVKPNPGELIVFSTDAGKPAIAPMSPNRMTFFTDALVRRLQSLATRPEEIGFADLFRSVALDVNRSMLAHPVPDIRELAQLPYVADNTRIPLRVLLRAPEPDKPAADAAPADTARRQREEQAAFDRVVGALWPRDAQRSAQQFQQDFPGSRFQASVEVAAAGAARGTQILSTQDIGLERESFRLRPDLGEAFNEDLRRASRGDKEAAARVGERVGETERGRGGPQFEGWMQFAAALGNGIAAFELARFYSRSNRSSEVGRWVSRAIELGYNPPPGLRGTR